MPRNVETVLPCVGCGGIVERSQASRCRPCHARVVKEWRKTHPLTAEQRKKDSARSYASVYERRGLLKRQSCQRCDAQNAERHHADYDKPLVVTWLCRPCHLALHAAEGMFPVKQLRAAP